MVRRYQSPRRDNKSFGLSPFRLLIWYPLHQPNVSPSCEDTRIHFRFGCFLHQSQKTSITPLTCTSCLLISLETLVQERDEHCVSTFCFSFIQWFSLNMSLDRCHCECCRNLTCLGRQRLVERSNQPSLEQSVKQCFTFTSNHVQCQNQPSLFDRQSRLADLCSIARDPPHIIRFDLI
jgi:hypothetical protein